jgi:SAM-dependent methyltransferase
MTLADMKETHPGIRVNVGCGLSPTPGWLNLDNSLSVRVARWPTISAMLRRTGFLAAKSGELAEMARDGNVRFANAAVRIPCATASVTAVYSSHMIEHLDRFEARAFLTEVKRVLRPGGVVRIAAPDLARMVSGYVADGDADGFVASIHMGLDRPAELRAWVKWTVVGPRHHLWMYDGKSLSRLLRETGFEDAAVMPPGSTRIPGPGQLDLRERAAESVYVEAVRPR